MANWRSPDDCAHRGVAPLGRAVAFLRRNSGGVSGALDKQTPADAALSMRRPIVAIPPIASFSEGASQAGAVQPVQVRPG